MTRLSLDDTDFDAIAAVTGQDVEWVVPRGTP